MCVCWLLQIWIYVHKYSYIKLAKGQRSTVHFPKTRLPWELFDMNRRAIAARIGAAIARLRNVLSWRAGKRWQWSWWVIWASHVCVWHVSCVCVCGGVFYLCLALPQLFFGCKYSHLHATQLLTTPTSKSNACATTYRHTYSYV